MFIRSKKGFTLVELLAVIVILAIILAIAIPGISGIINNSKKAAFQSDVKMIITGIEYRVLENQTDPTTYPLPALNTELKSDIDDYGANPANYDTVKISSLNPVTVSVTSAANSQFGQWTATNATKATVNVVSGTGA